MPPTGDGVVLGIDFGATNCVVAVVQDGDAEVLQNDIGSRSTPSCVHVSKDTASEDPVRDVGEAALRLAVSNPHGTVRNVKSVLGSLYSDISYQGSPLAAVKIGRSNSGKGVVIYLQSAMSPEEVASMLLLHLKKAAEELLGQGEIRKAVIAVPSYFNAAQRQSVKDAAYLAGLQVERLVNETSAAALVYARDRESPKTVVIVDVGGGGSSIAVVKTGAGMVSVLAASGRRLPGGEDFDAHMVQHFVEELKAAGLEVKSPRSLEILRSQWERAKAKLSRIPATKISTFLPDTNHDFQRDIPRALFEEQCRPLFQKIVAELRVTLEKARVAVNQVDDVVLVGGSSRVPLLRTMVQDALVNRPVCKAVSADEAVAKGAALLAAQCVRLEEVSTLTTVALVSGNENRVDANTILPQARQLEHTGSVMVRQGCLDGLDVGAEDTGLAIIFEMKARANDYRPHQFSIDVSGCLRLLDVQGQPMMAPLNGCLSSEALHLAQQKVKSRLQDDEADLQRIETKNELEEKCRAGLSEAQEADAAGDLDPHLIRALAEASQEHLQWLMANPTAPREELSRRLSGIQGPWQDLLHSRKQRQEVARLREKLAKRCRRNLDNEGERADGDPEAQLVRDLRRESEMCLQWLGQGPCTYDDVSERLAALALHWFHLQDNREQREKDDAAARQREAEGQLRTKLSGLCCDILNQEKEPARGDPDVHLVQELRRKCEDNLQWLQTASCHELSRAHAALESQRQELQHLRNKAAEAARRKAEARGAEEASRRAAETAARGGRGVGVRGASAGASEAGLGLTEDSVRVLYECVFLDEALRRKSFCRYSQEDHGAATAVLRALADDAVATALRAAAAAGRGLLLLDQVQTPGLVALSVRYLQGDGARRTVERLLALRPALTTTAEDLVQCLGDMKGSGLAAALRHVAWEEAPGPVRVLAPQLLRLLREEEAAASAPTRSWSGSHCLYRSIGAACAERVEEVRLLLETVEELQRVFSGAPLSVLQRACPAVTPEAWCTVRGVVGVLADLRTLADVRDALEELMLRQALAPARTRHLLDAAGDAKLHVTARILDAVFAAAEDVAGLLAFFGPTDLSAVPRCLEALSDGCAVVAAARGSAASSGRLRYESLRAASPLVQRVLAAARDGVLAAVRQSAAALWLRHALAEESPEDVLDPVIEGVELAGRQTVLDDLRRLRQRPTQDAGQWRCPRKLLAACPGNTLREDFPALEEALHGLAVVAPVAGPCCPHCGGSAEPRPVESLTASMLGAGLCPDAVLEPTMVLLSSTGWNAAHQHRMDVSRVVAALRHGALDGAVS